MRRLLAQAALAVILLAGAAQAQTVSDLRPLTLPYPVNHVFHFGNNDETATITQQHTAQDGLDQYHIQLSSQGAGDHEVILRTPHGPRTMINSDPSGARHAFRLAYGHIDHGRQDMLLLTATQHAAPQPAPVTLTVYRLVDSQFQPVLHLHSPTPTCSAELALRMQFGLPPQLPAQHDATGCPTAPPMAAPPPAQPITVTPLPTAPAAPEMAAADCPAVLRQQHETLCESYVYRLMSDTAAMDSKTQEWANRAATVPQCHSIDDLRPAADAALATWTKMSQAVGASADDKQHLLHAGCAAP